MIKFQVLMVAAVNGKKQPDEDNLLYFYEFVDFFVVFIFNLSDYHP